MALHAADTEKEAARLFDQKTMIAIELLERGLEVSARAPIVAIVPRLKAPLGLAYALSGEPRRGIALLHEAMSVMEAGKFKTDESRVLTWLGQALLTELAIEDSKAYARKAFKTAQEYGERGHEAWALRLLGEVNEIDDAVRDADDCFRHSLALSTRLKMRPLAAHCHVSLSKLCLRMGKRQEAQEAFKAGTTMHREMGMTYWLDKAAREFQAI